MTEANPQAQAPAPTPPAGSNEGLPNSSNPPATPPEGGNPPATPPVAGDPPATPPEGGDNPPTPPEGGTDWREQYAGDDEKKLNVLKRYGSQKDALDALFAARGKISADDKGALPDNATDEQKTAFRAENGIPATADDYASDLPEGLVIGDDEKEAFKGFFDKMHGKNMPQDTMNDVMSSYFEAEEARVEARQEADREATLLTDEALREEWGPDYKANKNMIKNAISLFFPAEFHKEIEESRLASGTPLFASKEGAMAFANIARQLAPAGTTVNSEGSTDIGSIESTLKSLQSQMGTKSWHADTAKQKQFRDLADAYERNTGKVWTGQQG